MAVVDFRDFRCVVRSGEDAGGGLREMEKEIDANTVVSCPDNRSLLGKLANGGALGLGVACGTDDKGLPLRRSGFKQWHSGGVETEVYNDVALVELLASVVTLIASGDDADIMLGGGSLDSQAHAPAGSIK